jgi:hypothetical protein
MVIYLNEDRAFHSWVTHHRGGYVLDGLRPPSKKPFTIHRANCSAVRLSATRRTHWTTGKHLKACALGASELIEWVKQETSKEPLLCEACAPLIKEGVNPSQDGDELPSLPRLTNEILEYILDTAIINLDHEDPTYRVTAGDVARYLNKTIGQISSGVFRLRDSGFLQLAKLRGNAKLSENTLVYPTASALQTLAIFKGESPNQLSKYIATLQTGSL